MVDTIERLLGHDGNDAGCDGAFAVLDQYVEALIDGADVAAQFQEFVTHICSCVACREDTDALLATLRAGDAEPA